MPHADPHLHTHIHTKRQKRQKLTTLDWVAMVAACLYPLTGVPQVIEVFSGHKDGVSVVTWLGFLSFSMLFAFYGVKRKVLPMAINNLIWIVVDLFVITGIIFA